MYFVIFNYTLLIRVVCCYFAVSSCAAAVFRSKLQHSTAILILALLIVLVGHLVTILVIFLYKWIVFRHTRGMLWYMINALWVKVTYTVLPRNIKVHTKIYTHQTNSHSINYLFVPVFVFYALLCFS